MTGKETKKTAQSIDGISLSAFLQLLELERKSCTLIVSQGGAIGHMYFLEGQLIDAEYKDLFGLEAAYAILSWENPAFRLSDTEERIQRITLSLTHVLLTASTKNDERKARAGKPTPKKSQQAPSLGPALTNLIKRLIEIPGVKNYYVLNRQGRVLAQSSKKQKIGDFIAYCLVGAVQIQEVLGAKALHNIRIRMPDDNMLLVIPQKNFTISLMLSQAASLSEVFSALRKILSPKQRKST